MNPDEFLTALDEAIGCQQCGGDLTGSVSDEFCTDTCQHAWYAQHAEPLTSYTEAASWEVLRCETAARWSPPWEWRLPRSTSNLRGDVRAAQRALNEAEHEWQRKAARLRLDSLMERHAAAQAAGAAQLQAFGTAMGESVREAAENFVAGLVEGMRGLEPSFRAAAEAMGEWSRIRERAAADQSPHRVMAAAWLNEQAAGRQARQIDWEAPFRAQLAIDPASPETHAVATIVHPDGTVYVLPTPARPGLHVRADNYLLQASVYARTVVEERMRGQWDGTSVTDEELVSLGEWTVTGHETAGEALEDEAPAPVEGGTRRERRERLASNRGRAEAEVRRSHAGPTPRRLDRR